MNTYFFFIFWGAFYEEIQDPSKNGEKMIFGKSPVDSSKFCLHCSVLHRFQDKCVFAFYKKFKMAAKNDLKMIFQKSCQ